MPYTTVVAGTTITAAWGNANVRDQVVTPFASAAARTSAILSPVSGMLTARTDVGIMEAYDGSAWQQVGYYPSLLYVRRSADHAGRTNNTIAADDVLVLTVAANAIYEITSEIFYTAGGAAATNGLKVGWSGPSGATFDWTWYGKIDTDGTATATSTWMAGRAIGDQLSSGGAGATLCAARPHGLLITSSTSGSFSFQWAQSTTNGTATIIKAGSFLIARRVG